MQNPLLEVRSVSAGYGSKLILRDITFTVNRGDFLSIIAPNGTGKSTLLRCIGGVLPVQKGSINICGQDIRAFSRRALAKKIAVVSEEDATFDYSVYQTAFMGRFAHISRFGGETPEDHRIVQQVLNDVGMWEKRQVNMSQLSQGERQKVLIARALAQCPELLLLDEPTSHLDIRNQFLILKLIKELTAKNNIAVIGVLHDINLALRFSTHLALLKDGRMLAYGSPDVLTEEILGVMYGLNFVLRHYEGYVYVQPSYT
ncbi:ABC transporter related [Thermosinus carboxydivorans Nor1]|uniref:ABC transporter related n=1 Tax=Thermosinus carboxydivorans Nor1 TaxID=401526 RepID=A1HQS2_9FIRM|nr:ABC transporter ATP-binding protein [Thermosinus carboxydivorans]EAX47633.1 ABC transporter related [Thermosinus carboxydivorans Nor1]